MPKRDDAYMQQQRDAIARAALTVLIEKGYYETSLRDICRAAGVSNGALYSYFPTREAVIVAACAIDHQAHLALPLPENWADYVEIPQVDRMEVGNYESRRYRLSLQFSAEISQMTHNPEGLGALYEVHRSNIRRGLLELEARGVVTLPLGIEVTTDLHLQLFQGVVYQIGGNREVDREQAIAAFRQGLALTAGLIEPVADG